MLANNKRADQTSGMRIFVVRICCSHAIAAKSDTLTTRPGLSFSLLMFISLVDQKTIYGLFDKQ